MAFPFFLHIFLHTIFKSKVLTLQDYKLLECMWLGIGGCSASTRDWGKKVSLQNKNIILMFLLLYFARYVKKCVRPVSCRDSKRLLKGIFSFFFFLKASILENIVWRKTVNINPHLLGFCYINEFRRFSLVNCTCIYILSSLLPIRLGVQLNKISFPRKTMNKQI